MPTYTYRCTKCEHEFEAFERITAHTRTRKCPVCGKRAERVITGGAGFLFKGEGFYVTDYRSEEYRTRAKEEKETVADTKAEKEIATDARDGDVAQKAQPAPAGKPARKKGKKKR